MSALAEVMVTMEGSPMLTEFLSLFQGNPLVVGLDDDGHGKPGPLRMHPEDADNEWVTLAGGHLRGTTGIGVYPMWRNYVHWGCVDLDDGAASWNQALHLQQILDFFKVPAFIERSKSKGYHVWVFCSEWVPAKLMREALLVACAVVDVPSREVNPKQIRLADDQIGNYVRLPYKAGFLDSDRQVVVDPLDVPIPVDAFIALAQASLVDPAKLATLAKVYIAEELQPVKPLVHAQAGPWRDRLSPVAAAKLDRGPMHDHEDRSAWLMGLGFAAAESGLTPAEVAECVALGDQRHTVKYVRRPDAQARYEDIARKASGAHQAS